MLFTWVRQMLCQHHEIEYQANSGRLPFIIRRAADSTTSFLCSGTNIILLIVVVFVVCIGIDAVDCIGINAVVVKRGSWKHDLLNSVRKQKCRVDNIQLKVDSRPKNSKCDVVVPHSDGWNDNVGKIMKIVFSHIYYYMRVHKSIVYIQITARTTHSTSDILQY